MKKVTKLTSEGTPCLWHLGDRHRHADCRPHQVNPDGPENYPEGLTEPTLSGPIHMRQPQIRWSERLGDSWTLHAAIEDPSSPDVFSDQPVFRQTSLPDGVLGIEFDPGKTGHLQLTGSHYNRVVAGEPKVWATRDFDSKA